jgi:hypothetical protein
MIITPLAHTAGLVRSAAAAVSLTFARAARAHSSSHNTLTHTLCAVAGSAAQRPPAAESERSARAPPPDPKAEAGSAIGEDPPARLFLCRRRPRAAIFYYLIVLSLLASFSHFTLTCCLMCAVTSDRDRHQIIAL